MLGRALAPRVRVLSRRLGARGCHAHVGEGSQDKDVFPARLVHAVAVSPTVRRLDFEVGRAGFSFQPGQWVDVFIPGMAAVGGFSLCSTAADLPRVTLAVKRARHPPAAWCYERAAVGDEVHMRVGGKFTHACRQGGPQGGAAGLRLGEDGVRHLLLIAGGVGLNPLYSMLQDFARCTQRALAESARAQGADARDSMPAASLIFSAASPQELLFRDQLRQLRDASRGRIRLQLLATDHVGDLPAQEALDVVQQRISLRHVGDALAWADTVTSGAGAIAAETLCFVCGPPAMSEDVSELVRRAGVPDRNVRFEKWW